MLITLHKNARTTPAIRAEIAASSESTTVWWSASMAVSAMFYRVITSLVVRTWCKLCTATCYSPINSFLNLL